MSNSTNYKETIQEHNTKLQQAIDKAEALPDASGGVNTCTMRFIPYTSSSAWETINPATLFGDYYYTKCVNGVISAEAVTDLGMTSDFDITIENVVCGSFLYFGSSADSINEDDANGATLLSTVRNCCTFTASNEPNVVCTFKLGCTS